MLTPWRRKSALGYSSGFLSSDMKEKKATWPGWVVSIWKILSVVVICFGVSRTCICKDDICDSFECFVKARLHCHIDLAGSRFFNPNTSHCDDHGRNDGYETDNSHIADLLQCSRQRADQADEEAYEAE